MRSYRKLINFNIVGFLILLILTILFIANQTVFTKTISRSKQIEFSGDIIESKDLSAVGFVGKYMIIGADEGNTIQVLESDRDRAIYQVANNIELPVVKLSKPEIDIEGIAVSGNTIYVVGSHSSNNKGEKEDNRKSVFRFELDPNTGKLNSSIQKKSLQRILSQDNVLQEFANLQRKKNGVDIEGIAVKGDRLYFGFRTPVLKNNYVPVVVVEFDRLDRDEYELRYVNLEGSGIRDMVSVDRGFLILADATGDNVNHYRVYFWNGSDNLLKSNEEREIKSLSKIPTKKDTKAEGLTILQETASSYQILVVYDGVKQGNPTVFEIEK